MASTRYVGFRLTAGNAYPSLAACLDRVAAVWSMHCHSPQNGSRLICHLALSSHLYWHLMRLDSCFVTGFSALILNVACTLHSAWGFKPHSVGNHLQSGVCMSLAEAWQADSPHAYPSLPACLDRVLTTDMPPRTELSPLLASDASGHLLCDRLQCFDFECGLHSAFGMGV